MKTFQLVDDRVVSIKGNVVTIKQKGTDKAFEFTPTRYNIQLFRISLIVLLFIVLNIVLFIVLFFTFTQRHLTVGVIGGPLSAKCSKKSMPRPSSYHATTMDQSDTRHISVVVNTFPSRLATSASTFVRSTSHTASRTSDRPRRASLYVSTNGPT